MATYTRRRRSRSGTLRRSRTRVGTGRRRTTARRSTRRRSSSSGRTVRVVVQMVQPSTAVAPVGQARQVVRRARF